MAANTNASIKNPKASVADDDDDVDDLDDVLEQFTPRAAAKSPAPPAPAPAQAQVISSASSSIPTVPASSFPPPSPTPGSSFPQSAPTSTSTSTWPAPPKADEEEDEEENDDFTRELQRGMEQLMRELVPGPPLGGPSTGTVGANPGSKEQIQAQEAAFKAAWEAMLVEGMDGMVPPSANAASGAAAGEFAGNAGAKGAAAPVAKADGQGAGAGGGKKDFQAGIRAAVDKLKESESAMKDSAGPSAPDPLEALLTQLSASLGVDPSSLGEGLGAGEGEGEEDLAGMLEMMMGSLMSKDVLCEPLKELSEKFPPYLATHSDLPAPERARYEAQQTAIVRILAVFEAPDYSEEDEGKKAEIVQLMSEMQSHGAPPTEIMGDLPPGFSLPGLPGAGGEEGEGCCIM